MDRISCIASVCHEANRAYCATLGDYSQPSWENAPEWQRQSAINGVIFHLAAHEMGKTPPPSASHDSWLEEKRAAGWKYGPEKNPATKEHPCFVPYDMLPAAQKLKDYIFGAIVKAYHDAELQPLNLERKSA
jgi:RyR domain